LKKVRNQDAWDELFEAQHVGLAYQKMGLLTDDDTWLRTTSLSMEQTLGFNSLVSGRGRPSYLVKHFTSATDLDLADGCVEAEVLLVPANIATSSGREFDGQASTLVQDESGM